TAAVKVAGAKVTAAKLDLEFCRVQAPLDGRIGRPLVTPGNLARADGTALARIDSAGPMYVAFDVPARAFPPLRRPARGKKIKEDRLPVLMGLSDETGFPRKGTLASVGARVDPTTGAVRMRALFADADGELIPGLSARVRMPIAAPRKAILLPEACLS